MSETYEVELKFRVEPSSSIRDKLLSLGALGRGSVVQRDCYFNHPSRDFRSTDEAFRIRSIGEHNCITYKGAVLGNVAKTRHEIEIGFGEGQQTAQQLVEMFTLLGFRFVREVQKTRQTFELDWQNRSFEIACDEVPGLGNFVELETIAIGNDRGMAEAAVWELAQALKLSVTENRSYLDMLVESDGLL